MDLFHGRVISQASSNARYSNTQASHVHNMQAYYTMNVIILGGEFDNIWYIPQLKRVIM